MKKLGRLTRRFRHVDDDRVGTPAPDFDSRREEIVGGNIGAESIIGKTSDGGGDLASDILSGEIPNDEEQRLDWYLDQLHISEGCPHNKER